MAFCLPTPYRRRTSNMIHYNTSKLNMPREALGGSWCGHGARAQHNICRTPRPLPPFASFSLRAGIVAQYHYPVYIRHNHDI
ncbi:unnamed protein product [Peniophora sp. CBMAI 1063]|nr:unnamed protein product [Peniophora sp. CBMAI 1063]